MANKWDQYIVEEPQANQWDKYVVDDSQPKEPDQQTKQSGNPLADFLDWYGRAGASNLAGMANAMSLGTARPAIKAMTGQDIGEGSALGRMAGTIIPAGAVGKGVGLLAKGASPLVRGALKLGAEGAVASVANTPEEDFKKYIQTLPGKVAGGATGNLALGGALQGAGKLYNMIPDNAKKFAIREMNSLIKPSKNFFSYSKNPGRGLVEEGIVGNSLDDILVKTQDAQKRIWNEVSNKVKGSNARIDLSDTGSFIDDAIARASKTPKTNKDLIRRLKDTKSDLLKIAHLKSMTPEQVMDFKQTVGDLTKFTGNKTDDELVNSALKKIYGNAKSKLDSSVKGISDLTERYADLVSAKLSIENRIKTSQSQPIMGWMPKAALMVGGGIAGSLGGGPIGGALGLGSALALEKLAGSTAAKTRLAQFLANNVSKAKVSPSTLGKVSSSVVGGASGLIR